MFVYVLGWPPLPHSSHPQQFRFCFYHAQKEARARAAQKLSKDLAYFFSGDYLSGCDLSTALARLIPAVVRGDVKSKTARTVAYLAQTLLQSIHISEQEYINAFGTDGWRKSIRNSVKGNYDYRFPPDPQPEQSAPSALRTNPRSESPQPQPQPQPDETPVNCHSEPAARREEPVFSASQPGHSSPVTRHSPLPQPPQPAPSSRTPMPPASAEFVQHVVAGLQTGAAQAPESAPATQPAQTGSPIPTQASPTASRAPQTPASPSNSTLPASNTAKTPRVPATQFVRSVAPAAHPDNPRRTAASTPQPAPNKDARALHFDPTYRLLIDGNPFRINTYTPTHNC